MKVKEKRFLEQEWEVFTSLTVWGHSHPSQSVLRHKERKQSQSAEPQAVAGFTKRGACQLHSEADGTEEFAIEIKERERKGKSCIFAAQ